MVADGAGVEKSERRKRINEGGCAYYARVSAVAAGNIRGARCNAISNVALGPVQRRGGV